MEVLNIVLTRSVSEDELGFDFASQFFLAHASGWDKTPTHDRGWVETRTQRLLGNRTTLRAVR